MVFGRDTHKPKRLIILSLKGMTPKVPLQTTFPLFNEMKLHLKPLEFSPISQSIEVAEQIFVLHEKCSQCNYETVHQLEATLSQTKPASAKSVKVFRQAFFFLNR